jgi:AcrR family transcriptional regulator
LNEHGHPAADSDELPKHAYHHGDLRGALLRAAEEELTEKGMEGFTLRGCAKRAGVSHAAPAHHFKDANALLTELAAIGFERFTEAMHARQRQAGDDPRWRLINAGLGYIDFAKANPALFRLMFSSFRPDFDTMNLKGGATRAFNLLVESVAAARGVVPGSDPRVLRDVAAAWSVAHGLADLVLANRMPFLKAIAGDDPERVYADIIGRSVPEEPLPALLETPGGVTLSGRDFCG